MERIMNEGFDTEAEKSTVSDTLEMPEAMLSEEDTEGEDLLLAQIDAFRNKAAKLQQLINAKEDKAAELEAMVKEKEAVNLELQDELYKKREEADSIVADVETQVDRMLNELKLSMDRIEADVKTLVNDNENSLKDSYEKVTCAISEINVKLEAVSTDLSEKNHSESVHLYRLLQDELTEHDKADALAAKSDSHFKSLKAVSVVVLIISLLGLACGLVSLLISMGVIIL